jgi:predicted lipoprotein with Yx(FWY)xxD motif
MDEGHRMSRWWPASLALLAAAMVLACAACQGAPRPEPSSSGGGVNLTAPSPTATAAPGPLELRTRTSGEGKEVLTDHRGLTVYAGTAPHGWQPMCTGHCGYVWQPVLVGAAAVSPDVPGVSFKVGVSPRPERGWRQLTVDGCRIYTFTGDHRPGDAFGHGMINVIGGHQVTWHAIALTQNSRPDGLPIKLTALPPERLPKLSDPSHCR